MEFATVQQQGPITRLVSYVAFTPHHGVVSYTAFTPHCGVMSYTAFTPHRGVVSYTAFYPTSRCRKTKTTSQFDAMGGLGVSTDVILQLGQGHG
jgi:hypothetical protein